MGMPTSRAMKTRAGALLTGRGYRGRGGWVGADAACILHGIQLVSDAP